MFLRRPETSFCFQSKFWFKWDCWLLGMVSAALCRGPDSLPLDHAKSCWFHHGSPRILCLWGTTNAKCQWNFEEQWTHTPCVCSTHIHVFTIVASLAVGHAAEMWWSDVHHLHAWSYTVIHAPSSALIWKLCWRWHRCWGKAPAPRNHCLKEQLFWTSHKN